MGDTAIFFDHIRSGNLVEVTRLLSKHPELIKPGSVVDNT